MTKKCVPLTLVIFLVFTITQPVFAQTYAFNLDREVVHVLCQSDGNLYLQYEFVLTNAT